MRRVPNEHAVRTLQGAEEREVDHNSLSLLSAVSNNKPYSAPVRVGKELRKVPRDECQKTLGSLRREGVIIQGLKFGGHI